MAKLNVKTIVTGPDEIEVPLVRADFFTTSNVFRVCFEVFLAIAGALVGVVLTVEKTTTLHWVFLLVVCLAGLAFLVLAVVYYSKAKSRKR